MKTVVNGLRWLFMKLGGGVRGVGGVTGVVAAVMVCAMVTLRAGGGEGNRSGEVGEVRGTWLTTTANDAISTPEKTAATMKRLREIGINTVYVECWKNGYTQYPSEVLQRTVGVDRRPALMKSDPSDPPERASGAGRDLLGETLAEAKKNDLTYIAWFEYGFMAAFKDSDTHLRRMKPEWLSRDKSGNEVAPNGFVWMNPLHPETRRFLLDIVLEAVDKYDLDGIQLDDRIVWPYVTMGYDEYTKKVYAEEHGGRLPPENEKDAGWMRWRADKVNEFSKMFVQEVRARKPGLIISLSPAPYPWVYDHYLLEWPKWAAWTAADGLAKPVNMANTPEVGWSGAGVKPGWDEFIPQCYRFSYDAFEKTWMQQVEQMNVLGAGRVKDLVAGIRVVGEGADSTWEDLRKSMEVVRKTGGGGHVHWFSRGVLDVYPRELMEFYNVKELGYVRHPRARGAARGGAGAGGDQGEGAAHKSTGEAAAALMQGHFSSEEQSQTSRAFFDIRLHMTRIWPGATDGVWLYVEQAMRSAQDKPYRQRVYRVVGLADGRARSDIYMLPGEAITFAGAWKDVNRFDGMKPTDLSIKDGCSVFLLPSGDGKYEGSTQGHECKSNLQGATYTTSEVKLDGEGMRSWDRGFDSGGKQVWGAVEGPYIFKRVSEAEAAAAAKEDAEGKPRPDAK